MNRNSGARHDRRDPTASSLIPSGLGPRINIAADPETSTAVVEALAVDSSPRVRCAIASRPGLSEPILRRLTVDPDVKVRQAVAENPSCPPSILVELVDDPSFHVRFAVLENPRVDRRVHEAICRSTNEDLRRLLAETEPLDDDVKNALRQDAAAAVRGGMASSTTDPQILAALVEDADPKVRAAAALNPATTREQRRRLARDRSAAVRMALVQSAELEEEDLGILTTDRSTNVRWWLATVPSTPKRFLEILAKDKDPQVRTQARMRLGLQG